MLRRFVACTLLALVVTWAGAAKATLVLAGNANNVLRVATFEGAPGNALQTAAQVGAIGGSGLTAGDVSASATLNWVYTPGSLIHALGTVDAFVAGEEAPKERDAEAQFFQGFDVVGTALTVRITSRYDVSGNDFPAWNQGFGPSAMLALTSADFNTVYYQPAIPDNGTFADVVTLTLAPGQYFLAVDLTAGAVAGEVGANRSMSGAYDVKFEVLDLAAAAVPEPMTAGLAMLALTGAAVAGLRRRGR